MIGTQAMDVVSRQGATVHNMRDVASPLSRSRPNLEGLAASVNQNGCFEFDRVIKSGYVEKRTQKTKQWKTVYIVLRPNTLSLYKNENETKLRHQIHLSDLTAVALLKDPKHKRENVFGLFSPSKNFHLQAATAKDAQEWVELIRKDARIDEEEEEMFLASPLARSMSPTELMASGPARFSLRDGDRMLSSSPETYVTPAPGFISAARRASSTADWSGMSGNELPSHSDLSDNEGHGQRQLGTSIESLAVQSPINAGSLPRGGLAARSVPNRSNSQVDIHINTNVHLEQDPDRVIWQGWIWMLRSKRGVRQWKDMWGVLRPRNLILYKDESEYTAQWIVQLSAVVNVVDIDPLSKSKQHCLQIITEEKSYRFCTHGEESLVQLIGAFKSLLAKRRGLEARAAASL